MPDWILFFFFFLIRDPVSFDSWLQGWKGGNEGIVRVWLAFTPQAFPTEPSRAEPSPLVFLSSQQTKPGPYNRSALSLCLVIPFQPTICQLSQRRPLFTYCCIKPFYYFITVSHSSVGWAQAGGSFPSLASGPHVIAVLSRGSGAGPLSLPTCSAVLTLPRGPPLWGVVSY